MLSIILSIAGVIGAAILFVDAVLLLIEGDTDKRTSWFRKAMRILGVLLTGPALLYILLAILLFSQMAG